MKKIFNNLILCYLMIHFRLLFLVIIQTNLREAGLRVYDPPIK